jgi:HEAT repeat protein
MRRQRWSARLSAAWWAAALAVAGLCGCRAQDRTACLEKARQILPAALSSPEPAERALALEVYRDLDLAAPENTLRPLLSDSVISVRFTALLVEADQARQSEASYFDKVFREAPDPNIRLAAVYALAKLGNSHYMQTLADGLTDSEPVVRRNAALVLGLLGNRSAVGMLKWRLQDPDPVVRLNAAEAMARLGEYSGLPAIRKLAEDTQCPVQVNAILALGRVGQAGEDVRRLRELQGGQTPISVAAKMASFGARAMLGDYSQAAFLAEVASGAAEPQDRAFALQLLARAGYGPVWRQVCPSLSDSDGLVRLSAAWAMLSFHSPRAERVMKNVSAAPLPQMLTESQVLRPASETPQGPGRPGPLQPSGGSRK